MTIVFVASFVFLLFLCWHLDRTRLKEKRLKEQYKRERDELAERIYGSPEAFERAQARKTRSYLPREIKVANEAAIKGIPRSNKQYPSRFKGTR
jgi:predicted Rossmann fold nucleotide-binding protein DprA/Smf involved in DNA uptake